VILISIEERAERLTVKPVSDTENSLHFDVYCHSRHKIYNVRYMKSKNTWLCDCTYFAINGTKKSCSHVLASQNFNKKSIQNNTHEQQTTDVSDKHINP
jgi:hypothetical protein